MKPHVNNYWIINNFEVDGRQNRTISRLTQKWHLAIKKAFTFVLPINTRLQQHVAKSDISVQYLWLIEFEWQTKRYRGVTCSILVNIYDCCHLERVHKGITNRLPPVNRTELNTKCKQTITRCVIGNCMNGSKRSNLYICRRW